MMALVLFGSCSGRKILLFTHIFTWVILTYMERLDNNIHRTEVFFPAVVLVVALLLSYVKQDWCLPDDPVWKAAEFIRLVKVLYSASYQPPFNTAEVRGL